MTIEISDHHPIPASPKNESKDPAKRGKMGRKSDGRQKAILKLQVGQSFFIPTSVSSVSTLRWWAKAKHPSREFTSRPENDGVRIWRIK